MTIAQKLLHRFANSCNLVVDASSKIHFSPFAPQARTMSSSEDDDEGGRIRFTTEGDYEDGQWMDDGEFYARGEVSVGVSRAVGRHREAIRQ